MTLAGYVRCALAAPVIVPLLAYPLLWVDGAPFDRVGQLLVGSLVVGLVPYLLFALVFAAWARDRPPPQVERAAWLAPLAFLVPFAGFWVLLLTFRGADEVLGVTLGLSGFALALGYVYVLLADLLYRLLAARGVIRPKLA